jgi:hypothetical protein
MLVNFRQVCGVVLGGLMAVSALLSIMGIWGMVEGETVWKLLGTFCVVGGSTIGLSYVADSFFGKK